MNESRTPPLVPRVRFAGTVAKRGNEPAECEDHCAAAGRRFAVADGATEASYSGIWAGILTESFCEPDHRGAAERWLDHARAEWQRQADHLSARDLPWFTREALRAGSFASFIGLSFSPEAAHDWTAVSCGDSCLFAVRDDALLLAAPITGSHDFTNAPALISSQRGAGTEAFSIVTGRAEPGDSFYLCTDALSQWFLARHELGDRPWTLLDSAAPSGAFEALVAELRESGTLRNDDVALLSIAIGFEE